MTGWELLEAMQKMTSEELRLPVEIIMGLNERHVYQIEDVQVDVDRRIIRVKPE